MRQIKRIEKNIRRGVINILLGLYGLQINFGIGVISVTETIYISLFRRAVVIILPIGITVTDQKEELINELGSHALLQMRLIAIDHGHWGFRKSRKLDIPIWLGFDFTRPIVNRIKH